jgi:hypothetical protein
VGIDDIFSTASSFGAEGDPTKNVNVTNWPIQQETFPKNLILRGTWPVSISYTLSNSTAYFAGLVDKDTPYPDKYTRSDFFWIAYNVTINASGTYFADRFFVYEKVPANSYQILGSPSVSLTYNLTCSLYGARVQWEVWLGVIDSTDQWKPLSFLGLASGQGAYGATNVEFGKSLYSTILTPITVNPYERIAIKIQTDARSLGGNTTLDLWLKFAANTDELLVSVPILETP